MDHDFGQQGQRRLESFPDPASEHFTGGIVQSRDVVEIVVVELIVEGLEGCLHVGKVHYPPSPRVEVAGHMDFHSEAMAVQLGALVARRNIWQTVCGFDGEDFEDVHGAIVLRRGLPVF